MDNIIMDVSLPTTSDHSCVSHSIKVEDELFCADFKPRVKHEESGIQRSAQQVKFEAPDVKYGITSASDDFFIKLEPLENEELLIKDEIDQNPTNRTTEKSIRSEYFVCSLCNSKFTNKNILQRHVMKIHLGDKPIKCNLCDVSCTDKSHLLDHIIKTHSGEKRFKCSICDYRCRQKHTLLNHIKRHTEDKLFKCSVCGCRFIQKSDLRRHIKTHTINKNFTCSVCSYRCIGQSNLSRHIKIHMIEKTFKCSICDYRFIAKSALSNHIKTHKGKKTLKCVIRSVNSKLSTIQENMIKHQEKNQ